MNEHEYFKTAKGVESTTTNDLTEGTNLYYTDTRVDDRLALTPINNLFDVTTSFPADKELLSYNSGTGEWINRTFTELGLYNPIESVEVDAESSRTGISYQNKASLTFTSLASDYLIFWSAEISTSFNNTRVKVQITKNTSIICNEIDPIPDGTGGNGWGVVSAAFRTTLTAASHTFDMNYATSVNNKTVSIRRARIYAMKV